MKKTFLALIIIVMLFSLLGCSTNTPPVQEEKMPVENTAEMNLQNQVQNRVENVPEEGVPEENNEETVASENYFYNDTNFAYNPNSVTVKPRYVYWEDGALIAECFVVNGLSVPVYNVNVEKFALGNTSGEIASASFGTLEGVSIAPYSYVVWTFCFPEDCVYLPNAELGYLTNSDFVSYNY